MKRLHRWLLLALVLLVALVGRAPERAEAHPLGNFTVNQYSRLQVGRDAVQVRYIIDMAEIPTFQERQTIDRDGDGQVSADESAAYLAQRTPVLVSGLQLRVNNAPSALRTVTQDLSFPTGQGGLLTMRLTLDLEAAIGDAKQPIALDYQDSNFAERIGWREIVIQPADGTTLSGATVPAQDQSDELRNYPQDMLTSPLDLRAAHASASFGAATGEALQSATAAQPANARVPDSFANLIATRELTPPVIALALLLALLLGAGHALTPGHGKTIVAAYLVGARGTAKHALFLGITTTVTHTAGVFILGFITLWISHYILPEQLYPWLEFISGVLVVCIGLVLFRGRLMHMLGRRSASAAAHDHSHDDAEFFDPGHDHGPNGHSHVPLGANGGPVTWRSLLALGISGGILPCPSALVVLLSAIALHRLAFGMLLIVAFSVGLAGVLTGIGMLLVYARRLFDRFPVNGRLLQALPVASAAFVTLAGLAITAGALVQAGVVRV